MILPAGPSFDPGTHVPCPSSPQRCTVRLYHPLRSSWCPSSWKAAFYSPFCTILGGASVSRRGMLSLHSFEPCRLGVRKGASQITPVPFRCFETRTSLRIRCLHPLTHLPTGIGRVRLGIAKDTALGMKSLYAHGMQHRHLTSKSILLTSDFRAKVWIAIHASPSLYVLGEELRDSALIS